MEAILLSLAILILLASGFGITILLWGRDRPVRLIELSGLSVLFGMPFVSLATFVMGFFLRGAVLVSATAFACLIMAAAGIAAKRRLAIQIGKFGSMRKIDWLFMGLLAVQVGFVIWLTVHQTLFWDGLLNWEIKARYAFLNGGTLPTEYFSDPTRGYSHPDYPLLLPLTEAWLYAWLGRADQGLVKIIFPFFYVVALGFLYVGGLRIGERRWQRFLPPLLLFFVPLALNGGGGVASGYADFPLAVFYLVSVLFLLDYCETNNKASLRLFAALSACLPWIKQEGLILFLGIAILLGLETFRRRQIGSFLATVFPGILLSLGWRVFMKIVGAETARDFHPFTLTLLWNNIGRSGEIGTGLLKELINWSHWGPLWIGVIFALPLFWMKGRNKQPTTLLWALIFPLILYPCVYFFSTWPVTLHIQGSLSRLILHLVPLGVLIVGLAIPVVTYSVSIVCGHSWKIRFFVRDLSENNSVKD